MKTAGIVGGLGPEATIVYYRSILERYKARRGDGSAPSLVINSIDVKKMLGLIAAGDLPAVTEYLLREIGRLHGAGADFGALSANAPHIVFDDLRRASPIPLVSIVETACDAARALGLSKVGLLGIRFTMQGRFYPETFERAGVRIVPPAPPDLEIVHDVYANELMAGKVLPASREKVLAVVRRMRRDDGIEGVVLGGTEMALMFDQAEAEGLPLLDTTRLHVDRIVETLLA